MAPDERGGFRGVSGGRVVPEEVGEWEGLGAACGLQGEGWERRNTKGDGLTCRSFPSPPASAVNASVVFSWQRTDLDDFLAGSECDLGTPPLPFPQEAGIRQKFG